MGMLPKSSKLLNIFSVTEEMKIMPTETINNTASPSCEGVLHRLDDAWNYNR